MLATVTFSLKNDFSFIAKCRIHNYIMNAINSQMNEILLEKLRHASDYLEEVRCALRGGDSDELASELSMAIGRVERVMDQLAAE
jgi:hypothetical protein